MGWLWYVPVDTSIYIYIYKHPMSRIRTPDTPTQFMLYIYPNDMESNTFVFVCI